MDEIASAAINAIIEIKLMIVNLQKLPLIIHMISMTSTISLQKNNVNLTKYYRCKKLNTIMNI